MSPNDPARRGFLRSLAALPLVGGGVTLIGSPTASAEPVTPALLREYANWIAIEQCRVMRELGLPMDRFSVDLSGPAHDWHREASLGLFPAEPSTRAAVVLAAVGCDWRQA